MKKQILLNPDNSGVDICRTIKTTYHKISTANLIRGGTYGASGVIEISMEKNRTKNSRLHTRPQRESSEAQS